MKLKPIGDKLVIEMVEVEEKTSSGIVLPTSKLDKKEYIVVKIADVLAVVED